MDGKKSNIELLKIKFYPHKTSHKMTKYETIMVRTVDTDVVVILIAHIQDISAQEVWIAFGMG